MVGLLPVVRHMIVCEDIPNDPEKPRRVTLVNLLSGIRSRAQPPFPFLYPKLCAFVQLTECRGTAEVRLQIEQADNQTVIFRTPPRSASFKNDPLKVFNVFFRVLGCIFPDVGLYWVQLCYNDAVIFQVPLTLE